MCPFSHLGSLLGFLIHFYKLTRHRFNNNVHSYGFFHLRGPWIVLQTHQCNIEIPCRRIRLLSAQLQQEFGWLRNAHGCKRYRGRKLESSTHGRRTWREGCSMGCPGQSPLKRGHRDVWDGSERGNQDGEKQRKCSFMYFLELLGCSVPRHGEAWKTLGDQEFLSVLLLSQGIHVQQAAVPTRTGNF